MSHSIVSQSSENVQDSSSQERADWSDIGQILDKATAKIKLFLTTRPDEFGDEKNVHFQKVPVELNSGNVDLVLQQDHTAIQFRDGYSNADNFVEALTFVMDIDNGGILSEIKVQTKQGVHERLCSIGINHMVISSRNDGLPKTQKRRGKDLVDDGLPREKMHVYFPLSKTLDCDEKYELSIEWAIQEFDADPDAFGKHQKIFGYGNHPNPRCMMYLDGQNLDDFLKVHEADLSGVVYGNFRERFKKKKTSKTKNEKSSKAKQTVNKDDSSEDHNPVSNDPCNPKEKQYSQWLFPGWKDHAPRILKEAGWETQWNSNATRLELWHPNQDTKKRPCGNIEKGKVCLFRWYECFKPGIAYPVSQLFAFCIFGGTSEESLLKLSELYPGNMKQVFGKPSGESDTPKPSNPTALQSWCSPCAVQCAVTQTHAAKGLLYIHYTSAHKKGGRL